MSNRNNSFVKQYYDISQEKNTILCVGIDPAIPSQRSKNVIPTENRLEFIRNLVTDVAPYASAIKMNRQYLIGLTIDEIRAINIQIHQNNMLSIIDHKLSDIGSSNMSAIFWIKEESFDAFTFSPFAGNVLEATQYAHSKNLGIFVLTLMSNPEAEFQKQALIEDKPLYLYIADLCKSANSDGNVIGATEHITSEEISELHETLGKDKLALIPGVGSQGGNAKKILYHFEKKSIVNVGRAIIYSENPIAEAQKYRDILNNQLNEIFTLKYGTETVTD
ncbi:MAG: orotidine 5'-phosphate decarboxylase [Candidatus Thorarchaeota archaeon]